MKKKNTRIADKPAAGTPASRPHPRAFQEISAAEQVELQRWARQRTSPHRLVVRSRIVLLASMGLTVVAIAARLQVAAATVRLWRRRFAQGGVAALTSDAPRRGRPAGISLAAAAAVIDATRHLTARRRTVRGVACQAGTSPTTVWRVWRRFGLGPDSSSVDADAAMRKLLSETRDDGR